MSEKRWKVYDSPQINPMFSGIVCVISASDRLIAVITEDETPVDPSTWGDIARLIAAAPELVKAGEAVLAALDGRVHSNPALKALVDLSAALSAAREG